MIDLSDQQGEALERVREWIATPGAPQVFRLFGYAGTGKTTLARFMSDQLPMTRRFREKIWDEEQGSYVECDTFVPQVLFAAYTGKAALVLARKGCKPASTIHRLIYVPVSEDKDPWIEVTVDHPLIQDYMSFHSLPADHPFVLHQIEETQRRLRQEAKREQVKHSRQNGPQFVLRERDQCQLAFADVLALDEASMVSAELAVDLQSFHTRILVLGDPAQLPPVKGAGYYTEAEPDFLLTEIHRQARDNPIIALASHVREGNPLRLSHSREGAQVVPFDEVPTDVLFARDTQVLVGLNATRKAFNRWYRLEHGLPPGRPPVPGDKLVCLRNNYDKSILNGSLWIVDEYVRAIEADDKYFGKPYLIHRLKVHSEDDPDIFAVIDVPDVFFTGTEQDIAMMPFGIRRNHDEFDYGYALTVHKSQGSQWDRVVVFDQSPHFNDSRYRWLYTGITRAAQKLVVVKPEFRIPV